MRVLLLGGTGFIGDAAVGRLRAAGADVSTASRSPRADVHFDATDPESLAVVLASPFDAVVNLAGAGLSAASADPATMTAVNAVLPARILQLLEERDVGTRLVHAASSTERLPGQTTDESEYSRTKHEGSQRLREAAADSTVPLTILTIHNTYGPDQPPARFVAAVSSALSEGRPVTLNYPDRVRDFVYVDDVAACIARAALAVHERTLELHVGTGVGTSLREAALLIASAVDADPDLVRTSPARTDDPNPVTVAPELGGGFGLCTMGFADGIRRTVEES